MKTLLFPRLRKKTVFGVITDSFLSLISHHFFNQQVLFAYILIFLNFNLKNTLKNLTTYSHHDDCHYSGYRNHHLPPYVIIEIPEAKKTYPKLIQNQKGIQHAFQCHTGALFNKPTQGLYSCDQDSLNVPVSLTNLQTGYFLTLGPRPPFSSSIYFRKPCSCKFFLCPFVMYEKLFKSLWPVF